MELKRALEEKLKLSQLLLNKIDLENFEDRFEMGLKAHKLNRFRRF